ncbi:phage tail protein [Glaesserella parasuis]|uniref:phage tail-collar fiber domain-containing protein n=1 Tax=Glaesserella parasuis TaxID=738 RepID=UPI0024363F98|nr:phage tail protein [Glaesserella parasuis]MDG6240796.1 phage tail protein [Glaesserella parasuis]MDG6293904.1 phage tail protein [Glaesserella parasuis]MDG6316806.1 phage tail protein [Glaesserella parasuis]MDO9817616.1 phage tail protein [Glaesserella parasuis]MDO9828380.1 phage tail protein [Glaesserella parasuis]
MAKTYYSVLTTYGSQLFANAMTNRQAVNIAHFAVGDGNGRAVQPDSTRTSLVREVHKASISAVSRDPRNNRQVIFELTLPENVGGFWIREMGIFDNAGRLVAIANCPDTYKPRLDEGSGKIQVLRMILLVSSSDAVTLKVDDTVIFVTRGQFTPKTITANSINGFDDTGHSHAIDTATTSRKGITQLTNDTGLDSEVLALTAKAGKAIAQSVAQLQLSTTNALNQKVNKTDISNAVNSTSQTTVASSQAVKTAYDLANSKYTAQDASPTQKGLVQLANNLTTDDATKALTAAQGKALKDKIDGIEIGGRNLIKNSRLLNGTNHWTIIGGQDLRNGIAVLKSLDTSTEWWWRQSFNLPEKQYTFSAEVKPERTAFYIHLQNGERWLNFYARNLTPGVWQKISITFVSAVRQITFVNPGEGLVELQNPMLVEGNRAMTWAPAPEDAEDYNRQNYVAKSGDTMTGILNINHAASYLRGKNNDVDDWFVGRVRDNDNDVALVSYQYSTGVHLKADRVESNKPIYHGANKVFDEGNLLPVKQINLRSHIPNTQIEYQNATPAELPVGSYIGFTTNAQLSGNGVFSGWGFVSKTDNTQAFRQAVNFDRHFAQWGNNASGWGSVHEYFMLRPQLGVSSLNDVTMCGVYSQVANVNAQPNLNYPAQEAGTLLVTPSAYGYQQEYTTFYSNKKFVRSRESNRWLPWKQIDGADWSEVRNKPTTASGLGINDFDNRVTALFTYQKIGNFEIRKYPDGTMIQTYFYDVNDLKEWIEKQFTWAVAFADKPMVIPKVEHTYGINSDVGSAIMRKSTNAVCYYKLYEHNSENQGDCRVQFLGVGRWK